METIDPNFFSQAVREIESQLVNTGVKTEGVISVNVAMLQMLKNYVQTHKLKHRRATISLVKPNSKKRKRPASRGLFELATKFG